MPSSPTCLHGDLHIGNIITDGQRDLWIDVGDFAYGVPEWDLGMMYYSAYFISAQRADSIFHLDNATLRAHWDAFAPVYYGTDSREVLDAEVKKLQPYIAAKLAFVISTNRCFLNSIYISFYCCPIKILFYELRWQRYAIISTYAPPCPQFYDILAKKWWILELIRKREQ